MIPDGWTLYSFGDIVVKSQYGLSIPSSLDGQYYIFKMNNFKDGKMNPRKVDKVNLSDADLEKFMLNHGDILINRTNSIDLVGKTGVFDLEGVFTFASYLVRFQVNRTIANPFFVNFFFNWSESQQRLKEIATLGVSQANINPTALQKYFKILLPPLLEQCRIAEVLGVWDESIDLLERLIGKTRSRKQGLMQQLLTGKKRFKEFESSEWRTIKLSDFFTEISKKNTNNEDLIVLSCSKVYGIVPQSSIFAKRIASEDTKRYKIVEANNLVYDPMLLWDASIGFVESVNRGVISPAYNTFKYKGSYDVLPYFRYLFKSYEFKEIYKVISQGTNVRRRKAPAKTFLSIEFEFPQSVPEQEKIAAVLSAADEEISTLEKQLAAYKQQKLGLMQQLLTGRIRI
ncbi:restriction endonuclease subunit S [Chamaesiphon sp. VAR_48_metabat_403]|uniref:restriction endonuclease subunit S n=1 Tax=Chamaesiphon sp. VAR_48_metabat_403 TaxID=2964700 RepID=UPI00286E307B|nr:restriction endonuclease subunit S [Chamaesiphon sp. VAR_48_metabat_403]